MPCAVAGRRCRNTVPRWPVSLSTPLSVPPLRKVLPDLDDARQLTDAGRFDEAEYIIQDIVSLSAPEADTFYLLGVIAHARGRYAERAISIARRCISIRSTTRRSRIWRQCSMPAATPSGHGS